MKELSIEEKARRYDEAIAIAKEINNEQCAQSFDVMTRVFPELKESEDEMIRKKMIALFKGQIPSTSAEDNKKFVAWLEKQRAIDVLDEEEREFADNVDSYRKEIDAAYQKGYNEGVKATLEKQTEQKPAWSEEDERLCQCIIEDQEEALDKISNDKYGHSEIISDLEEMYRERIAFLKSLKDRVRPKQEWSEEDRRMLIGLIDELDAIMNKATSNEISVYSKYTNWLKSLKDRYTWKPSDEQLKQLGKYCPDNRPLTSSYEQLKKLKG